MKDAIEKYCVESDVIVLAGKNHHNITSLLLSNPNNNVKSYYILDNNEEDANLGNQVQTLTYTDAVSFIVGELNNILYDEEL